MSLCVFVLCYSSFADLAEILMKERLLNPFGVGDLDVHISDFLCAFDIFREICKGKLVDEIDSC